MCSKSKLLINHPDGHLALCECGTHLLCFKNIHLEFTKKEFGYFLEYINSIDLNYWKNQFNSFTACKRNIPIPTNQGNLLLVFNKSEFENMKTLFFSKKNIFLKFNQISEEFSKN